ncbi:metal ABC transporter substrate-binding protein [Granulicoccus sp. GXG6511]|uniref:metal ABC transporter substrate-binding protein n=1 Tax=Granulicoccus sp. GXG6511 TaxID=3381351 RepID=UPI003D7EA9E9
MRSFTRTAGVALATAALLATAACGGGTGSTTNDPGTGDKLDVVVAFYPLQFTAERVAGDAATITNLTQPGADAHGLELTPRQIAALSEADLVIYQSGFQPAVDDAIAQIKPARALDVTRVATVHTVDAAGEHVHAGEDAHAGENEHAGEEGHTEDDGHNHGSADPHLWLDLDNMRKIADATAEQLGEVRPEEQSAFRTNADALKGEYVTLDESFKSGLATCERREIIVSHAAFGYLTDRYDLTQIPIRGLEPDLEPSPARVAEVQRLAREHGVTTIFYETLVSPAVAEAVAGDLGLKTDVLDPLEGLTPQSKGSTYLEVMNSNLAALKAANACS